MTIIDEIREFCEEFDLEIEIEDIVIDEHYNKVTVNRRVMEILLEEGVDLIKEYQYLTKYSFIDVEYLDECREAYVNGYYDRRKEVECEYNGSCCNAAGKNNNNLKLEKWYWLGYANLDALDGVYMI